MNFFLHIHNRLGESCSHIGAMLFKIEAAVRLGYTNTTCTEQVCKWNNDFVKKVRPTKVTEINFGEKLRNDTISTK